MKKRSAEFTFGSWSAPESPLTIDYPLEILDELRAAACDGMRQLARGGIEVGGVLFGVRKENAIRILTWRAIACEHARGPALMLSAADRMALEAMLESAREDAELRGLQAVGWFVSHTRSEIFLSAADAEIYAQFFPWNWQVTLVLRPERGGSCRAGFFVREENGVVRAEVSYKEFVIAPLGAGGQNPPNTLVRQPELEQEDGEATRATLMTSVVRAEPAPRLLLDHSDVPRFLVQRKSEQSRWVWGLPLLLAIVFLAALVEQRYPARGPALTSGFRIEGRGSRLALVWDASSRAIGEASGGVLDIKDGKADEQRALTKEELKQGSWTYTGQPGDLEATLTLKESSGRAVIERARYVATSNTPGKALTGGYSDPEKNRLAAENARLREDLRKAYTRTDRLEGRIRELLKQIGETPENP